jgi:hypothetical protein
MSCMHDLPQGGAHLSRNHNASTIYLILPAILEPYIRSPTTLSRELNSFYLPPQMIKY